MLGRRNVGSEPEDDGAKMWLKVGVLEKLMRALGLRKHEHEWVKVGGALKQGAGRFKQHYRCASCGETLAEEIEDS